MFAVSLTSGPAERQRRYRAKHKAAALMVDLRRYSGNEILGLTGRLHDGTASRQDQLTAAALIVKLTSRLGPADFELQGITRQEALRRAILAA